ncbi:MAG: class I SAM-dependent RNA methyltransferase [Chlorobi bacterium]|nr:class I SAM-dependent RNA methyltransferase [Chlorobiota bacterium]
MSKLSTPDPANPILITAPKRLTSFLAKEVAALGYPVVAEQVTGVLTEGELADAMRLNLWVRTGHRVLYLLQSFAAPNADELYRQAVQIPWEEWVDVDGYVSVVSSVSNPTIRDTRFANVRLKDALCDRLGRLYGRRPDSGPDTNQAVIFLHWQDDACSVYLDTSGQPLIRRGYRKIPWRAPMQESLAAAVVMATGWSGEGNFINPMCGSGTLAIEAALIALGKAPGLLRSNFSFMHLCCTDEEAEAWKVMRAEAKQSARKTFPGKIIATDHSPEAIEAAQKNAATAGVDHLIEFRVCDFRQTPVPEGGGVVVLNPEYGERLGEERALEETYRAIGDFFKQHCSGYRGYVFTGNLDLAKRIGLRASRRIPMYNTTIDCRLLEFEMYEGSRKIKEQSGE